MRSDVTYFFYLARGDDDDLRAQVASGPRGAGYDVFYLKVGLDDGDDLRMVATLRDALGPGPRLRTRRQLQLVRCRRRVRMLERLAEYDIDFVEQPVRETPLGHLGELRSRSPIAVCANEGLWSEADAYARIRAREADVFCFSPSWVGSLGAFSRLAHVAELEGLKVCKHTHGELGIAAAACQHVLLTLPNAVDGQPADGADDGARRAQRGAAHRARPALGSSSTVPGLGVEVDPDAVAEAAGRYRSEGQYLPWQAYQLGREERA